jgi:phytoene dehydrogenase-like protein
MARRAIVVIGAGHNGLVAAAYLAKAGHRVMVLERSQEVGGILRGAEIAPGFRAPGIAHTVGRLRRSVVDDLGLRDHGLELLEPEVRVFAPQPDGSSVTFWSDPARTADELRARSPSDADAWMPFDRKVRAVAGFLAAVNAARPPDLRGPTPSDVLTGARLGLAFRRLGGSVGREAIRWMPMAVADMVQEVFEDEAVRGPLATRGVLFTALGPWSAGSAAVFLNDSAGNDGGAAGTAVFVRGGTEGLAAALSDAASEAGAEIRTRAEVVAIRSRNERIAGVTLADGTGIDAGTVVSAADPRRTLELCDPVELGPSLVWRRGNIRQSGATAKVNLALSGLPSFHDEPERLMGRIVIAPSIDYVERASDARKYGAVAEEPWIEATIPTLVDGSLAPEGKHVMSAIVQSAPRSLREGTWGDERERLGTLVVKTLERFAPGLGELVEATQVVTPEDLERDYALTGGHVQHAEPGLDQYFAWRPLNGAARYRFVLDGLYLAGSGAHPGGGITGGPGANAARVIRSDARRGRRR